MSIKLIPDITERPIDKYWGSTDGKAYKYGPYSSVEEAIKCTAYETAIKPSGIIWIAQECAYGIIDEFPNTMNIVIASLLKSHTIDNVDRSSASYIKTKDLDDLRDSFKKVFATWLYNLGYEKFSTSLINKQKIVISKDTYAEVNGEKHENEY